MFLYIDKVEFIQEEQTVPELPEVEVTRACIAPHITGNTVAGVTVHRSKLRWPVSPELVDLLPGQTIHSVERRGKYLLLHCPLGGVLIHLGMTGQLRILQNADDLGKHDHVELAFENGIVLRLNDARCFGSVLWAGSDPSAHKLLADLGPEPLTDSFNGAYLYRKSRGRKLAVKQFIMDHRVVAGVGNIYANEALFHAGILPTTPAGLLDEDRSEHLAQALKSELATAIEIGLAWLDPAARGGKVGYFPRQWAVYQRAGLPCESCAEPIQHIRSGQRSTFFCTTCQR